MSSLSRWCVVAALQTLTLFPAGAQIIQQKVPTVLKQIIIFGRHGVRSAAVPYSYLAPFTPQSYPVFDVPTGYLTGSGFANEQYLGTYFRSYLLAEGLITGNNAIDIPNSYFRANSIQRSYGSAAAFATGLFQSPFNSVPIYSYPLGQPDPVFDPISAKIGTLDAARAAAEASGIFNGPALASAYSAELSVIRSAIYNSSNGIAPTGFVDPTTVPIPLTVNTSNVVTANVINAGGIEDALLAADPFVMEYADGMPMQNVAFGQLSLSQISQQTRIITLDFAIEMTPPYLNQVQSSNAAAHILRSLQQTASGSAVPGAFTAPGPTVLLINSSDAYVVGVAGLLKTHWMLPGYQPDYAAPGGSLIFELRQNTSTSAWIVRVYYTAQTFDQLRNQTALTLAQPPATMQLLVPDGGQASGSLDVPFTQFSSLLNAAINLNYVQDPGAEVPPSPLTGVPLY
jgi:4-phytase / acid phosphatase